MAGRRFLPPPAAEAGAAPVCCSGMAPPKRCARALRFSGSCDRNVLTESSGERVQYDLQRQRRGLLI
jgi:hypothetical protein